MRPSFLYVTYSLRSRQVCSASLADLSISISLSIPAELVMMPSVLDVINALLPEREV